MPSEIRWKMSTSVDDEYDTTRISRGREREKLREKEKIKHRDCTLTTRNTARQT